MIEGVLPAAREIADLQVLVPALAVAALAEQASGNQPAALVLAREYEAAVRARPGQAGWYWGWWFLADLVRVCVAAGELDRAAALIGDAQPAVLRHRLSVLAARAVLAEARGELRQAAALYADAAAAGTPTAMSSSTARRCSASAAAASRSGNPAPSSPWPGPAGCSPG